MPFLPRLKHVFSSLLAPADDPRAVEDQPADGPSDLLGRLQEALAALATARRRLQGQLRRQRAQIEPLEEAARRALVEDREADARSMLRRRQAGRHVLERLEHQLAELADEEHRLRLAADQVEARMAAIQARQTLVTARSSAAEAQLRIGEALAGISHEMADLGIALETAESESDDLEARAAAVGELLDAPGLGSIRIAGLEELADSEAVEADLAALRRELRRC
ncbi:MAG: phage shock protein [Chloroflexota bacterium]|nr:phage shock protein [Chloroflexota bacterium]